MTWKMAGVAWATWRCDDREKGEIMVNVRKKKVLMVRGEFGRIIGIERTELCIVKV